MDAFPRSAYRDLHHLAKSVRVRDRSARAFNPASPNDIALFRAVLRWERCLDGFRSIHVRQQLFPSNNPGVFRARMLAFGAMSRAGPGLRSAPVELPHPSG